MASVSKVFGSVSKSCHFPGTPDYSCFLSRDSLAPIGYHLSHIQTSLLGLYIFAFTSSKHTGQPTLSGLPLSFYLRDHPQLSADLPLRRPHAEVSPEVLPNGSPFA